MAVHELAARLSVVEGGSGERIAERRERLGITVKALAEQAGVDRGVLTRIESGHSARTTSVRLIERALDDLEHEMGMDQPSIVEPPEPARPVVRFRVEGVYGAKAITVEVPPENVEALEAAVDRIMRQLREPPTP